MKTRVTSPRQLIVIRSEAGREPVGLKSTRNSRVRICRGVQECRRQLETAMDASWVSLDRTVLLSAIREWLPKSAQRRVRRGRLLFLDAQNQAPAVLRSLFQVVGDDPSFKFLALEEMFEALLAPVEQARDLLIGGVAEHDVQALSLVRGDLTDLVVPFSFFEAAGEIHPDFHALGFTDYGQTVKLGDYEAAADAILYGFDAEFRTRLNERRRAEEKGFGASLRRLRKQLRVRRTDFPGVDAKTIGRIERGEIRTPRNRTVESIEARLGMSLEQIETY